MSMWLFRRLMATLALLMLIVGTTVTPSQADTWHRNALGGNGLGRDDSRPKECGEIRPTRVFGETASR